MFPRPRRPNFNRRMDRGVPADRLEWLAERVRYGGNPEHKRNPGDFGLTPPSKPRPDKSLCDDVEVFKRDEALSLLRDGIHKGLVSAQKVDELPKMVWAVIQNGGRVLEARLENQATYTYHGYPLAATDPFAEVVRRHLKKKR